MNEKDLPYTDTTVLLFGPHKFTALSRVPAGYLLSLLKTKRAHPKPLIEYIEKNIDAITARHQGLIESPPIFRCPKGIYVSKKEANAFLDRIKNTSHQSGHTNVLSVDTGMSHLKQLKNTNKRSFVQKQFLPKILLIKGYFLLLYITACVRSV